VTERLGDYTLGERIAVGGMAEVFLATRAGDAAPVVIKRILPQLMRSPDAVAMFLDEGRLGGMLEHESIVRVLEVGEAPSGESFIALEFVDGPDLAQLLRDSKETDSPLPRPLVVWIAREAARALHAAHQARHAETGDKLRLVHRDVSPHNVLVSRDGKVKLTDFGVAKSEAQLNRTATGVLKGKVAYMSPEQVRGEAVDARTDVFALGVTLYEALVGRRPFGGKSEVEIIQAILQGTFTSPGEADRSIDLILEDIVTRMLAPKVEDRVPSADHVQRALDGWLATRGGDVGERALAGWMRGRVRRAPAADGFGWSIGARVPVASTPKDDPFAQDPPATRALRPLQRRRRRPSTASSPAPLSLPARRRDVVLYVEDDPRNFEVARLRLSRSYELLHAASDVSACDLIRTRGDQLAAVLMDVELRGSALDGVALVRLLRGREPAGDEGLPAYARDLPSLEVPIFYVTAHGPTYGDERLLASGADRVVGKPVDFAELTLALTNVHLRRTRRA
jgi:serine/threonine protein kinase/CheY-like chemotaxis protein